MSDTNWYEKFSILKGGEDGFCAGLLPAPTHPTGRHRDLDVQGLQYRLCWLICLYFFYYASQYRLVWLMSLFLLLCIPPPRPVLLLGLLAKLRHDQDDVMMFVALC